VAIILEKVFNMEDPEVFQKERVQPDSKPNEDGADPAPRKPGSKGRGLNQDA
jgi:hypothetical protein